MSARPLFSSLCLIVIEYEWTPKKARLHHQLQWAFCATGAHTCDEESETFPMRPAFHLVTGVWSRTCGHPGNRRSTPTQHNVPLLSLRWDWQSNLVPGPVSPPDRGLRRALTPVVPLCYVHLVPRVCCTGMP
jgi:hypothetical protein